MSSPARAEAARANGARSKGPVTIEGRARSSRNALRHGLCANAVVLPGEESDGFDQHRESYIQRFQPADQAELDLVETMAVSRWRMRRIPGLEVEVFENIHCANLDGHASEMSMGSVFMEAAEGKSLSLLLRYEGQLTRTYERSLKALQTLQKTRPTPPPEQPQTELRNEPKPKPSDADFDALKRLFRAPRERSDRTAPVRDRLEETSQAA